MKQEPRTLIEAVRYFSDLDVAHQHLVNLRWPYGVRCPHCGASDVRYLATRRVWECKEKHAKRQFSAKVGTIFENSPLGLDKWFVAIWQVANCKNGISSYEMARALGITQKSAWHLNHRIRKALELGTFEKLDGHVEADETQIGGSARNRRKGAPNKAKTIVAGAVERDGKAVAKVIQRANTWTLHGFVHATVSPDAETVSTDEHPGYGKLGETFRHGTVNHNRGQYVNGIFGTNTIEGVWALLKRTIRGTYVSVEPFHLDRYVGEQVFRYNLRKGADSDRFRAALKGVFGQRLTYKELTTNAKLATAS